MRDYLIKHGAEFRFQTCLKDIQIKENALHALVTEDDTVIPADVAILALGHSARDTFMMLYRHQLPMEAKNFAVGFRVEHPQQMIDDAMYGKRNALRLPAAPYKVTSNFPNGRGVYSFCMCPGGYVVNASSMKEKTCVNGMSYSGRSGKNANSAIIVSVSPADYGAQDPLDGMHFQETLEHKTYQLGNGKIPQQLFGDYRQNIASQGYGDFNSQTKGQTCFANLRGLMTEDMEHSFLLGMEHFRTLFRSLTGLMRFFPAWKHAPHLRCGSCGIQMERAVCTEFIRVEKAQDMREALCRQRWTVCVWLMM